MDAARDATQSPDLPEAARGLALPDGLVREAHAPDRLVLLWTARETQAVVGAVLEAGELPVTITPEETVSLVEESGAPSLLLVDSDLLDDATLAVLEDLRRRFPQTRVVVLADDDSAGEGLLRALRARLSEVVSPRDTEALVEVVRGAAEQQPGQERVLAVGAHPDDVEIGCGATLLRHRAAGHHLTVLTLSRGAVGGPQELRRREAVGAAVMMGAELVMGDLPDTRMSEATEAIGLVEQVIAAVRPTTLYVHSKWDNHQDHRAVHDVTMIAARRVPQVYCYQSPSSRNGFDPTRFVPVTDTIHDKVRLLAHYDSQATRHYLDPELVVASARYWARQLPSARYAEPFEVIRSSESDRLGSV